MEYIEYRWIKLFNRCENHHGTRSRTAGFLPEQLEYLESTYGNMVNYSNYLHLIPMIELDLACVFDANGNRRPTKITIPELIQEDPEYWANR